MVGFGRLDPEWVGRRFVEQQPSVNVTILTETEDPRILSEAMQAGAKAHVLKTADGNESR